MESKLISCILLCKLPSVAVLCADWLMRPSLTTVVRADVEQWLVFEFGWTVTEHVIGSPQGDALHLQPVDQVDQFTGTHKRITAHIPETRRHGTGENNYSYVILFSCMWSVSKHNDTHIAVKIVFQSRRLSLTWISEIRTTFN